MRLTLGAFLLLVTLCVTMVASESPCRSSWLADDLPQLLQDDGWEAAEQRYNVDVDWRPSTSAHHVARKYRATVRDLPASVEEVLAAWHTNAYSAQALVRTSRSLERSEFECIFAHVGRSSSSAGLQ